MDNKGNIRKVKKYLARCGTLHRDLLTDTAQESGPGNTDYSQTSNGNRFSAFDFSKSSSPTEVGSVFPVPYPYRMPTAKRVVVVQARVGSSRCPGKVLKPVGGCPLINRVLDRALAIAGTSEVVLATSTNPLDDSLAKKISLDYPDSVTIARGQEHDVRSRFIAVANQYPESLIARVTADDPFKDPTLYESAFEHLEEVGSAYVSVEPGSVPLGLDVEVFQAAALLRSEIAFTNEEAKEHVTTPLKTGREFSRSFLRVDNPMQVFGRLTVDYPEDLEFCDTIARIIDKFGGAFSYSTTLRALMEHNLQSGATKEARN